MAVRTLSYLDLTPEQRSQAATRLRDTLRGQLGNPFLSAEQRSVVQYQVDRITQWENGRLLPGAPFFPGPTKS